MAKSAYPKVMGQIKALNAGIGGRHEDSSASGGGAGAGAGSAEVRVLSNGDIRDLDTLVRLLQTWGTSRVIDRDAHLWDAGVAALEKMLRLWPAEMVFAGLDLMRSVLANSSGEDHCKEGAYFFCHNQCRRSLCLSCARECRCRCWCQSVDKGSFWMYRENPLVAHQCVLRQGASKLVCWWWCWQIVLLSTSPTVTDCFGALRPVAGTIRCRGHTLQLQPVSEAYAQSMQCGRTAGQQLVRCVICCGVGCKRSTRPPCTRAHRSREGCEASGVERDLPCAWRR